MGWLEISSLLLVLLFFSGTIGLKRENRLLQKENLRLLEKSGEYEVMKQEAKEQLKESTDIETIKSLRGKYRLSLLDAKKIVDAVK